MSLQCVCVIMSLKWIISEISSTFMANVYNNYIIMDIYTELKPNFIQSNRDSNPRHCDPTNGILTFSRKPASLSPKPPGPRYDMIWHMYMIWYDMTSDLTNQQCVRSLRSSSTQKQPFWIKWTWVTDVNLVSVLYRTAEKLNDKIFFVAV